MNIQTWADTQSVVIIDGALSTALEHRGLDLNHALWTAKVLVEQPEAIEAVHLDYFNVGANVVITSTYQASPLGFQALGYTEAEAEQLIRQSVALAKAARDKSTGTQQKWIAGSVGPYGAYLADGSEYRGDYQIETTALDAFHRNRLKWLIAEGVDILAIETMPNVEEIKVLLSLLSEYPEMVAWVTCTLKDATHISDGTALSEVQALLEAHSQVIAYGVNCVAPDLVVPTLTALNANRHKDLVVYPNGGAIYDPQTKAWAVSEATREVFQTQPPVWRELGAKWIGGCCCTTHEDIACVVEALR